LAKVLSVTNATKAKVKNYEKVENNNKILFNLPSSGNIKHIDRKLVHKVGIKLSKRNALGTRITKSLSPYYV
jgi:hypothetical protein